MPSHGEITVATVRWNPGGGGLLCFGLGNTGIVRGFQRYRDDVREGIRTGRGFFEGNFLFGLRKRPIFNLHSTVIAHLNGTLT